MSLLIARLDDGNLRLCVCWGEMTADVQKEGEHISEESERKEARAAVWLSVSSGNSDSIQPLEGLWEGL